MSDHETITSSPSKLASFFFQNKISVSIIVTVLMLAPVLIPGVGALVPIIFTLVALISCLKSGSVKLIGLKRPKSWMRTILLGAFLGFSLEILFHTLLEPLFEIVTSSQVDLSNLDNVKGNIPNFILMLIVGWGVGGFLEEMSFRGYIIPRIRMLLGENRLSTTIAVLVSAIPFGLAHMYQGWAGVLTTGVMGFCFALIFVKNNYNVWLPIMVHGFANTIGITVIYFDLVGAFRLF